VSNNTGSAISVLLIAILMLHGSPAQSSSEEYVQGTVVEVQKHKTQSPEYTMGGSNPSDAPLASRYYTYEVSIRIGCRIYVGRYDTPFDYLPSIFARDQRVELRLTKRVMYFDVPYSAGIRMRIVRRYAACGASPELQHPATVTSFSSLSEKIL